MLVTKGPLPSQAVRAHRVAPCQPPMMPILVPARDAHSLYAHIYNIYLATFGPTVGSVERALDADGS